MSEIDDIFASKAHQQPSPDPSTSALKKKKKKERANKTRAEVIQPLAMQEKSYKSKKRPAPETVVDPSVQIQHKRSRAASHSEPKPDSRKTKEDRDEFRDSRGAGQRRKTEEGWSVFKEAELGIDPGAGDTPLCPFDCDCCF